MNHTALYSMLTRMPLILVLVLMVSHTRFSFAENISDTALTTATGAAPDSSELESDETDSLIQNPAGVLPRDSTASDTTVFLLHRARGIGVGAQLMQFPLFTLWQKDLSYERTDVSAYRYIPLQWLTATDSIDSVRVRYEERKTPPAFNLAFPVHMDWHLTEHVWLETSAFYIGKSYKGFLQPDTLRSAITIAHDCRFFTLSQGIACMRPVPGALFTVDGADRVFFTAAAALHPLTMVSTSSTRTSSQTNDSLWTHVTGHLPSWPATITAFGLGISWEIGLLTLRTVGPGQAIQARCSYRGTWYGQFHETNGDILYERAIPPLGNEGEATPLSFFTHGIGIRFTFLGTPHTHADTSVGTDRQ